MRPIFIACGVALAMSAGLAHGQTAPAKPAAAAPAKYNTANTPIGVLMADPAAKAAVGKLVPKLVENPDILQQASGMSLKEIQEATKAYAPDLLSDAVLAQIDVELAKLPPKN